MTKDELKHIIKEQTMEATEVTEYLGITRQRLSTLNRTGVLTWVVPGYFYKEEVEQRKIEQEPLREKHYRPKGQ